MAETIFLFGYMGAGKSVIGKSLSKSINYDFYDLDNFIELKEKKKISQIFNDFNEVYFRNLENKYLKTLSQGKEKKIISLGGGTPCFKTNIDVINNTQLRFNDPRHLTFDLLWLGCIVVIGQPLSQRRLTREPQAI